MAEWKRKMAEHSTGKGHQKISYVPTLSRSESGPPTVAGYLFPSAPCHIDGFEWLESESNKPTTTARSRVRLAVVRGS